MSGKSSKLYWKNYALRRFLRIYPLFVLALILHGIFSLMGVQTVIDTLLDVPLHMLLIRGESIFWSIPVEFKYYLISPFIMWFCHKFLNWNNTKIAFFFAVSITVTIGIEFFFTLPHISTLKYFPIFLVGTIISIYELNRNEITISIKPPYLNLMGFGAFILILLTAPYYFEIIFGFKVNFNSSIFFFPYAVLWGTILLAAKYGKGLVQKILELKFLRFIGSISFSIYLFHMLFLEVVGMIGLHPQIQIYAFFILTILFSSVSYLIIERPLSKIRIYSNNVTEKGIRVKTTANKG